MHPPFLFCLLLISFSAPSYAAAHNHSYKWEDQTGLIHYSENPPEDPSARILASPQSQPTLSPPRPTDPPHTQIQSTPLEEASQTQQALSQITEAQKKMDEENCQQAQDRLKSLKQFNRVKMPDAEHPGQFKILTSEEKSKLEQQTQQSVDSFCHKK